MSIDDILRFDPYAYLPLGYTALFIFLGASIGSFFNVLSLRWPGTQIAKNDEEALFWLKLRNVKVSSQLRSDCHTLPLMGGRSVCPRCSIPIPLYLNIPIVSWLMLGGKAKCCKTKIPFRYLAFELFGALVFTFIAVFVGTSLYSSLLGLLLMLIVLAATIDFRDGFIPDLLFVWMIILLAVITMGPHWHDQQTAVINFIATYIGLRALFGSLGYIAQRDVIGQADILLISIIAAFLGSYAFMAFALCIPLMLITHLAIKLGFLRQGLFILLLDVKGIPAGPALASATLIVFMLLKTHLIV